MSDKQFVGPDVQGVASQGDAGEVSRRGLFLRPFGYLGIAIVWLALTAVVAGLLAVVPFAIVQQGTLASSPVVEKLKDPSEAAAMIFVVPLCSFVFGLIICLLLIGSFSLFVLSLIAFSRSLRPSFARERLTTTRWSSDAIGPVRLGGALSSMAKSGSPLAPYKDVLDKQSLSLIPVRSTRFSAFVTSLMFFAFVPSGGIVFASTWLGLSYWVTVVWVTWPVTGTASIFCMIATVGLTVVGVWRVRRAFTRNLAKQFAQSTT